MIVTLAIRGSTHANGYSQDTNLISALPFTLMRNTTGTTTEKNPAKTLGLGLEVQAEVKKTQNGRRNFTFSALKTPGQVMVGSVGFEPTTSRGPGLQGTSQAAKRRPGKPATLHVALRRLAHDPIAR